MKIKTTVVSIGLLFLNFIYFVSPVWAETPVQMIVFTNDSVVKEKAIPKRQILGNCSGFHADVMGTKYLFSAKHCVFNRGSSDHLQNFAVYYDFSGDLKNSDNYKFSDHVTNPEWKLLGNDSVDLMYAVADANAPENTPVLKLATKMPALGEDVFIQGFPDGAGPVEKTCQYIGHLASPIRITAVSEVLEVVKNELLCKNTPIQSLTGASGGVVTNKNHEVIGVFTSSMHVDGSANDTFIDVQDVMINNLKNNGGTLDYVPTLSDGKHKTNILDGDDIIYSEYSLKDGVVDGPLTLKNASGELIETINFQNGKEIKK